MVFLSLITIIICAYLSYESNSTNRRVNKEISILVQVLSESGYGGFIHNYKSYLLLDDHNYYTKANNQLEDLFILLNEVIDLEKDEKKKRDLNQIRNTFKHYQKNLEHIKKLKNNGTINIEKYYEENTFHDIKATESIEAIIKDLLELVQHNENLSSIYSYAFLFTSLSLLALLILLTRSWLQREQLIKREVLDKTAELENSNKFLELVIENNPDYIFVKDESFRITMANSNFLLMYPEQQRNNIIGTTTLEQYREEEAEHFLEMDKKAFAEGKSETVEKILFPDGITRTLQTKKIRFTNKENKLYILGIAKDITERERFTSQLTQVNDELEQFAYRVSHDIKSPLVTIKGLIKYIIQDIEEDKYEEALINLNIIQQQCEQLNTLTSDILDLSKADHIHDEYKSINLYELCEEKIAKYSFDIDEKSIIVKNIIPKSMLINVQITRLAQILDNLISNAIKYIDINKEQPLITINAESLDSDYKLTISDNGLGIPEHKHKEVFSMFKRFHANNVSGSGLGLAIVKKHIEKINATIEFLSSNKGTTFTIFLRKKC